MGSKTSSSISLFPLLIALWFFWGMCDDDKKTEIKQKAVEIIVETKEILIETKDGTLKTIDEARNELEKDDSFIKIVEPEEKKEEQAGPIGPLPDEEDKNKPEPEEEGRTL